MNTFHRIKFEQHFSFSCFCCCYYFSTIFIIILIGFISKQWSVKWNNGNIATSVSTRWMWWKSCVILSVPQLGGFLSSAHRQTVWSKDKVSSGNMGIHNWKYNHTKIPIISESILSDFLRWDWLFLFFSFVCQLVVLYLWYDVRWDVFGEHFFT